MARLLSRFVFCQLRASRVKYAFVSGIRSFSSNVSNSNRAITAKPPSGLQKEMAMGIQKAMQLFVRYGIGASRLKEIGNDKNKSPETLVNRWQKMMEIFVSVQIHVLTGLGYSPDQNGITLYNQHMLNLRQTMDPTDEEKLRLLSRDIWRETLTFAFNIPIESIENNQLSIVDARNIMYKVSQKMQDPQILETVAKRISSIIESDSKATDMQKRHTIVQEVLVHDVYLGGDPSFLSDCGFPDGELGYVLMQCTLADHQQDPLISQYLTGSMMKILQVAGIDMQMLNPASN